LRAPSLFRGWLRRKRRGDDWRAREQYNFVCTTLASNHFFMTFMLSYVVQIFITSYSIRFMLRRLRGEFLLSVTTSPAIG
jgi:hypothetical protein